MDTRAFASPKRLRPRRWVKPAYDAVSVAPIAILPHPFEPHALAVGEPRRDVAAFDAGLALRHLLVRRAHGVPPRRPLRRARQGGVDDLLDVVEAQREFRQRLPLQVIAERGVIVHGLTSSVIPGRATW